MVCEKLETGRLTAVDRSPAMIAAALRRNDIYVKRRRAEFLVQELEALDLGDRRFDLIFAIRVGPFHRDPARAEALVAPWLAPGGRIRSFYDEPAQ